jgi:penicillin-binding protein 1C
MIRSPERLALLALVLALVLWLRLGALPPGLLELQDPESIQLLDRNGELLYEARAGDGSKAAWLDADHLPQPLVNATIAAEDRRFLHHPGVDPIGIARALARNVRHGRALEGGSTITQQVAKLLYTRQNPDAPRGIARKLRETITALRLEHRFTKRQILALYLNLAPYGNQVVGAARASEAYFGHDASLLTPAQAAFLAALPRRPSGYNPYRDPERARARQREILSRMEATGLLTGDRLREAQAERLALTREPSTFLAPHFVQRVLAGCGAALQGCREEGRPEGLPHNRITTTLDAGLQREVEGIIRAQRQSLVRHGAHNVAVVVLDNASGEWLAWEGSGDYWDADHGGAIDGATTPRQPGSALKPFTYALAFDSGESPATVLADVPSFFPTAQDGVLYSPRNYDGAYRGPLLARRALAGSENVPAVALASRVGVPNLLRFFRSAGFTTFDKSASYYGLGVTLGDAEVRLDELVAAYAMFARGGAPLTTTMTRGEGAGGGDAIVSARAAFWITDILSDAEARAFAFGRGGSLEFPFPVAAKTGTSQAYRDNWTVGYTHEVTVGVWVGNFDRRPLIGSSGVTGAGPIFHDVMLAARLRAIGATARQAGATIERDEPRPAGTVRRAICALSGLAATDTCPRVIEEYTAAEDRQTPCYWHRATDGGVTVDWPVEYHTWAAGEHLLDRVVPVPGARVPGAGVPGAGVPGAGVPRADVLRLLSPPDGAVYLIDPTLRREFQTLSLRAAATRGDAVEWRIDDAVIGSTVGGRSLDWPLAVGRHVVSANDGRGRSVQAAIVVK